jgi:hypothetical protein
MRFDVMANRTYNMPNYPYFIASSYNCKLSSNFTLLVYLTTILECTPF